MGQASIASASALWRSVILSVDLRTESRVVEVLEVPRKRRSPKISNQGIKNTPVRLVRIGGKSVISSYEGRAVDALGQRADEGRGKRRYAGGSCNRAMIPGFPNGVTRLSDPQALPAECIGGVEGSR